MSSGAPSVFCRSSPTQIYEVTTTKPFPSRPQLIAPPRHCKKVGVCFLPEPLFGGRITVHAQKGLEDLPLNYPLALHFSLYDALGKGARARDPPSPLLCYSRESSRKAPLGGRAEGR
jgi:hypothetical protein